MQNRNKARMFALCILLSVISLCFPAAGTPATSVFIKVYEPTPLHGRLCAVTCPWFPLWLLIGCTDFYCGEITYAPPKVISSAEEKTDGDSEDKLVGCFITEYHLIWGSMSGDGRVESNFYHIDSFHFDVEGVLVDRWDNIDAAGRACAVETSDNQFYDTEDAAKQRARSLFPTGTVVRGIYRGIEIPVEDKLPSPYGEM